MVQVAKQPRQNSFETSAEKLQAGVWFIWNITKFCAKLASVNANRWKIMIYLHVTFAKCCQITTRAL